jgi:hypothetical protein
MNESLDPLTVIITTELFFCFMETPFAGVDFICTVQRERERERERELGRRKNVNIKISHL